MLEMFPVGDHEVAPFHLAAKEVLGFTQQGKGWSGPGSFQVMRRLIQVLISVFHTHL